jgi:2-keto-3-deoxygluconate permease
MLLKGGLAGILLGVLTTLFGGFFNIKADRLLGGTGIAGAAASSTAGNAVATPLAISQADPALAEVVAVATPLVATSVIVTALLTPMLTSWVAKRNQQRTKALVGEELQ